MRLPIHRKGMQLYAKIFITIILCIVITMLVLSTVFYTNYNKIVQNQIYSYNMNSLAQTSVDAFNMTDLAMNLIYQINLDMDIAKLKNNHEPDSYDISTATTQLERFRFYLPFVESIYVYNGKTNTFYISTGDKERKVLQTKNEFDDKGILNIINNFRNYGPNPIPREYLIDTFKELKGSCFTFIYYDHLQASSTLESAIFVNISENWLLSVIDSGINETGGNTYILNEEGQLVSNSRNYPVLTNLSNQKYIKTIMDNSLSGYLMDDVNGIKSLITYSEPDPLGWRYVRITPYKIIFNKVQKMRQTIVIISALILILGLAMAFIISRKLYIPIEKALSNLKNLENEKRKNSKVLKHDFLRNYLLDKELYDENSFNKKLIEFGIHLITRNRSFLLFLRIDKYYDFSQKYNIDDRNLLKFAIMNISEELCSALYNIESVDMGDERIALILNLSDMESEVPHYYLMNLIKGIQQAVLDNLMISISVTIGQSVDSVTQLNISYNRVVEASFHRLFRGHGSIISSDEIMEYKSKEYVYPVNKEKSLVDSIMVGNLANAKAIYLDIINETIEYPYNVINFVVMHLEFTINNAINIIYRNNSIPGLVEYNTYMISLEKVETIDEINIQFFDLFETITKKQGDKKNSKHENLVQSVNNLIEKEYMNPVLCLNSIANTLDMNPIYIGRLYKQHTLKTILEYITEVRMVKAKKLLQETEYSVCEVAEKIGFANSSYFHKAFKKENGVTPIDFRKSNLLSNKINVK